MRLKHGRDGRGGRDALYIKGFAFSGGRDYGREWSGY